MTIDNEPAFIQEYIDAHEQLAAERLKNYARQTNTTFSNIRLTSDRRRDDVIRLYEAIISVDLNKVVSLSDIMDTAIALEDALNEKHPALTIVSTPPAENP